MLASLTLLLGDKSALSGEKPDSNADLAGLVQHSPPPSNQSQGFNVAVDCGRE